MRYLTAVLMVGLVAAGAARQMVAVKLGAKAAAAKPEVVEAAKPVKGYEPVTLSAAIAPTLATAPMGKVEVFGQPRTSQGHPCTLWDKEDVNHFKGMLKTSKELQDQFAKLKAAMDKRMAKPLGVPVAQKDANGEWMFPGDTEAFKGKKYYRLSHENADVISDLGTVYALSGEAKYGEYCKKMLVAYAVGYPQYGHPLMRGQKWTERAYRSATDGRLTGQFLEDGGWLIRTARGCDLVWDLPSWTPEDRKAVREDLFEAIAYEFVADIVGTPSYLDQTHNRSVICNAGVLMAGYATDDQELINYGLYGKGGTKEKPVGGVMGTHFGPDCIGSDGLWNEGSPGYTNMALCALIDDAETVWHHGIDMYSYNDYILKRLLNSSVLMAGPDARMTLPAAHDSGLTPLLSDAAWLNHEVGVAYEYGYRRYRDPQYLPIILNEQKGLSMTVHQGATSLLYDLDPAEATKIPPRVLRNVNFTDVGYGILRTNGEGGPNGLLLEYGPSRSHGHPSKLAIDLYALNDVLLPLPGVIFPYNDPLDVKWYWTTPANCTLTVDETTQLYSHTMWQHRGLAQPQAAQTVYGPASTMGLQRAWSDTVYPATIVVGSGVTIDRALFLTEDYLADLYGAFGASPHKYDLAWHIRGQQPSVSQLKLDPMTFTGPVAPGYNALDNVRHATSDKAWSVSLTMSGQTARLVAAGGTETEVILGDGYFKGPKERPLTVLERRVGKNCALYGTAVDLSGRKEGYVKSVTQEGGLSEGYGLLKVQTANGTDLCFAAYRPGTYKAGGLETDAAQAMLVMDGQHVRAMYLGGGKTLKAAGATIERNESGLAYVEKLANGNYLVGNPSADEATVMVTLPGVTEATPFTVRLKGEAKAELTAKER